jgi:hypothetical protein
MSIRITSLVSSGPVWITLTSGAEMRLAPGATSAEYPDVDVKNNPSIESMVSSGLIKVDSAAASTGRRARSGKKDADGVEAARGAEGDAPN